MIARLFSRAVPSLREQLDRFKAAQVDGDQPIVPPTYIAGMDTPNRDRTHEWTDNDVIALELKKEREQKSQPKVRSINVKRVK